VLRVLIPAERRLVFALEQIGSGHTESSSLKRQHKQVFNILEMLAQKNNQKPFRKFVLYSLRHTFLTRLGESGCDAWTLARIAGHSDIRISARYVHPSEDAVLIAMTRLGGHKIGDSENPTDSESSDTEAVNSMKEKEKFGGRGRDRTGDPLLAKQVLSQLSYTP
jgi:integrase-like protein